MGRLGRPIFRNRQRRGRFLTRLAVENLAELIVRNVSQFTNDNRHLFFPFDHLLSELHPFKVVVLGIPLRNAPAIIVNVE